MKTNKSQVKFNKISGEKQHKQVLIHHASGPIDRSKPVRSLPNFNLDNYGSKCHSWKLTFISNVYFVTLWRLQI